MITCVDTLSHVFTSTAPTKSTVYTIPNDPVVTCGELEASTLSTLKALCRKHSLCAASSKLTKKQLIDLMILSCKLNEKDKANIMHRYTASSCFDGKGKYKEMTLPPMAMLYKKKYNLQDKFDHYLSNIDSNIISKSKNARLIEIYFFMAIVGSWTFWAESMVRYHYQTRNSYKIECLKCPANTVTTAFTITMFMKKLRNSFARSSMWLPQQLMKHNVDEYGVARK